MLLNALNNKRVLSYIVILFVVTLLFLIVFGILYKTKNRLLGNRNSVLILNTNRTVFKTGETVIFFISQTDRKGVVECQGDLKLFITNPNGNVTELKTSNGTITRSSRCGKNEILSNNDPDYRAEYSVNETGFYKIKLTKENDTTEVNTQIEVTNDPIFSIEREGASRINLLNNRRYFMRIKIYTKTDFSGQLIEYIPASLSIEWYGTAKANQSESSKTLTWDITQKAGETGKYIYEYTVENSEKNDKNGFFNLGKAVILGNTKKVFEESNYWKISTAK